MSDDLVKLIQKLKHLRISGNFCDDLILAFFVISIESQIIEDAEIIFCIIFLKKLFKSQKSTDAK